MTHERIRWLVMNGLIALIGAFCFLLLSEDLFPSLIVFLIMYISFLLTNDHKKDEKHDRGFVLNYNKLSNRRKLIRHLWFFPIYIIVAVGLWTLISVDVWRKVTVTLILLAAYVIELVSSYRDWKKTSL